MKPINIYALTRLKDLMRLERLERQMSKRAGFLKIKPWEIEGLRELCAHLREEIEGAESLEFYYSFSMPKLGKEFDLLRINDGIVVNIELKSGEVSDEVIQKQLIQNKYYLATLGRNMYFYTYISKTDRLVRLSNSGKLVDTMWEELAMVLDRQKDCYDGNIEELFKEDRYLISPLTDPGRFLRREYFLTSQQKDIERKILKNCGNYNGSRKRSKKTEARSNIPDNSSDEKCVSVQGFTGLPGTGKTILLYDIAMQLSRFKRVCVLHFGANEKELDLINDRLKRIDFYYCSTAAKIAIENKYSAILVDEGHRLDKKTLDDILCLAKEWNVPVIISYDREDSIAEDERKMYGAGLIESIPGYIRYQLTNRIRMNKELSSFISCVMYSRRGNHRRDYPSVSLVYAENVSEASRLIDNFEKKGYVYISDPSLAINSGVAEAASQIGFSEAACKEFDKVVMVIDETFEYDEYGYLRYAGRDKDEDMSGSRVRNLFHGLSRAKKNIAVVVINNVEVFDVLLYVLQSGPI